MEALDPAVCSLSRLSFFSVKNLAIGLMARQLPWPRPPPNAGPYAATRVTADGTRDILGNWIGTGGEGAKFWLQVLTEIKNRGTNDVCIVVCDGLKGLPEASRRPGRSR